MIIFAIECEQNDQTQEREKTQHWTNKDIEWLFEKRYVEFNTDR